MVFNSLGYDFGFGRDTFLVILEKATQEWQCGFYSHPNKDCTCPSGSVQKYLNKVSDPLLERIYLNVEVTPVAFNKLSAMRISENSATIRERIIKARDIQAERYKEHSGIYCNAQINKQNLKRDLCN
jgi:magnesium chelatase family protein